MPKQTLSIAEQERRRGGTDWKLYELENRMNVRESERMLANIHEMALQVLDMQRKRNA